MDAEEFMTRNGLTQLLPGEYEMSLVLNLPEGVRQEREITVTVAVADRIEEEMQEEMEE